MKLRISGLIVAFTLASLLGRQDPQRLKILEDAALFAALDDAQF